jgi:hypothetical protein
MSNREVLISLDFRIVPYSADYGNLVAYDSHIAITVSSGANLTYTGSGGIILSGAATTNIALTWTFAGTITLGGTAGVVDSLTTSGSGEIIIAGSATASKALTFTGTGSCVLSGSAAASLGRTATGSGSIVLGGSAAVTSARAATGSGGIIISGQAATDELVAPAELVVEVLPARPNAHWQHLDTYVPQIRSAPKSPRLVPTRGGKKKKSKNDDEKRSEHFVSSCAISLRPGAAANLSLVAHARPILEAPNPSADFSHSVRFISDEREIAELIACIEEELCYA